MTPEEIDQRLSHISTLWTVVLQAHGGTGEALTVAQKILMERYSGAVYRYLLGAVRDPDAATDLCQEFALRLVRGDFKRADPERGRFRNYLRAALINLVNDYYRNQRASPGQLPADVPEPAATAENTGSAEDFLNSWRAELLDHTWKALAQAQPTYHAALRLRIEHPDMPSSEMAARLSAQLGKPMPAASVRKALQRAHSKFADLLLEEVAGSIQDSAPDALEKELHELNLIKYCQDALQRRKGQG